MRHRLRLGEETVGEVRFALTATSLAGWHSALMQRNIALVTGAMLLSALIMGLMVYGLIKRIRTLLSHTQAIGAGDYSMAIDGAGRDEFHQLAAEFDRMRVMLKERSEALQFSEQRFRDFARAGSDWFWELDAQLHIAWLSENFDRFAGVRREDTYGKTAGHSDTEDNLANPVYCNYLQALHQRIAFRDVEVRRVTSEGTKWRRLSGVPIFDVQGGFQGYRGMTTDITDLYRVKQDAERQQQRFLEAVELFDGLFVLFDAERRMILGNRKCQEFLEAQGVGHLCKPGVTFDTMIDAQMEQGGIAAATGREQQWRQWRMARFDHPAGAFDIQISSDMWFHVRQQRLPDGGFLLAQFDISERKRAEKLLLQAKHDAERAHLAKSQFLATASHDLRQPLQGMRMLKDLLASRITDPETVAIVEDWEKPLTVMERLVNGYLDMNRLESGAVVPEPGVFPVMDLLMPLHDEFAAQVAAKRLNLRLASCSVAIRSDRLLLGQILRNLIANAIRYTDSGKILIGCRRHAGCLSLQVWDSGPGITAEQQDKIFEQFYQVGNRARSAGDGHGLGLAIADLTARLLDHPIRVVSRPGHGAMFAVDVPRAPLPAPAPESSEAEEQNVARPVAPGCVLIVEDDATIRRALELLLRSRDFPTTLCETGEQALQQIARNGLSPQLVITDLWLPGSETGMPWLNRLRQSLAPQIPVIVMTGDTSADLQSAVEACGGILLTKPVRSDKLLLVIGQQLSAA